MCVISAARKIIMNVFTVKIGNVCHFCSKKDHNECIYCKNCRTDDELEHLKQSRVFSKSTDHVDKKSENSYKNTREKFAVYKKLITPGDYGRVSKSHDELR